MTSSHRFTVKWEDLSCGDHPAPSQQFSALQSSRSWCGSLDPWNASRRRKRLGNRTRLAAAPELRAPAPLLRCTRSGTAFPIGPRGGAPPLPDARVPLGLAVAAARDPPVVALKGGGRLPAPWRASAAYYPCWACCCACPRAPGCLLPLPPRPRSPSSEY